MNLRKRKLRFLLLLTLVAAIAAGGSALWLNHRRHSSDVFTTQRPGEQKIVWHTMRTRWERGVFQDGSAQSIVSVTSDTASLYPITGDSVSRIDKESGSFTWTKPMTVSTETANDVLKWVVELAPGCVVAAQIAENTSSTNTSNSRISCLSQLNGAHLWEIALDARIASAPAIAGSRMMIPLTTGEVLCLDISSGYQFWRRQVSTTQYEPYKTGYRVLNLSADSSVCMARAGADHFVALDPVTGETLWSRSLSRNVTDAEQLAVPVTPFTLKDGVLYVAAAGGRVAAWNAFTGRTIWRHKFALKKDSNGWIPDASPIVTAGLVLTSQCGEISAVRRADGSRAWDRLELRSANTSTSGNLYREFWFVSPTSLNNIYIDSLNDRADTIYTTVNSDPVVSRSQHNCRSLSDIPNLVAVNINTGKERWRCQVEDSDSLQSLVPDGDRVYCAANDRLFVLEPGPADALIRLGETRSQLAYKMIEDLTQWSPKNDTLFARVRSRLLALFAHAPQQLPASGTHAKLTLLRLKDSSIPPLIDLLKHQLAEIDKQASPPLGAPVTTPDLSLPLDLLFDLHARSAIPALIQMLNTSHSPEARQDIAELLIRLDDPSTMRALFRYTRGCTDQDGLGGEEALNYLCRSATTSPAAGSDEPSQKELTDYLMGALPNPKAPGWLRRFALFELIRDRGPAAREAALSKFYYSAISHLMPSFDDLMQRDEIRSMLGPQTAAGFQPSLRARDVIGTWWGMFQCTYFGQPDIWVVQSKDGKHWSHPTVAFPGEWIWEHAVLGWHDRRGSMPPRLSLEWKDNEKHAHARSVPISKLYRDSDGDGVPDIVEREIGTNPVLADSLGSGLPDGMNKNPLYRPHRLSQDEQIYQAVIEALCQNSRFAFSRSAIAAGTSISVPVNPYTSLIIPSGPSSKGVPIYGHASAVLEYSADRTMPMPSNQQGLSFSKPVVGFDGKVDLNETRPYPLINGMVASGSFYSQGRFKEWFPYRMSPDKKRVRIGVTGASGVFDVEVDWMDGRWLPVECRLVQQQSRRGIEWFTSAPVRDWKAN